MSIHDVQFTSDHVIVKSRSHIHFIFKLAFPHWSVALWHRRRHFLTTLHTLKTYLYNTAFNSESIMYRCSDFWIFFCFGLSSTILNTKVAALLQNRLLHSYLSATTRCAELVQFVDLVKPWPFRSSSFPLSICCSFDYACFHAGCWLSYHVSKVD